MAQKGVQLNQEPSCCWVCVDPLKDPGTLPCGHSFCMSCVKLHWAEEDGPHSCPQCRQSFTPRPDLGKNTMLADLVEDLKKTGLHAAPGDPCSAGAGAVACDVCTGSKLKALQSCLKCEASYCETHLQPHYHSAAFRRHQLVEPSKTLQEHICSHHDEVMKMFCRTDQQCICYLCSVDRHRGHDTVSVAAERSERQREVEGSRLNIQQRIQDRENDVKLLQQEVEAINRSADEAVEDSEKTFSELIRLLEQRGSEVKQQLRSQQDTEVSRVKELQEELEQEITELKRRDAELEQLSHTEDHSQFLHSYTSLPPLSPSASSINVRPLRRFEDVTAAVSGLREKLQDVLTEGRTNVSLTGSDVGLEGPRGASVRTAHTDKKKRRRRRKCKKAPVEEAFVQGPGLNATPLDVWTQPEPEPEPRTRSDFLRYSRELSLDPNTAHPQLLLSEGNRRATVTSGRQRYPSHPDRFTGYLQVLSREALTGPCYWEVEWTGPGAFVAVTYGFILRAGRSHHCALGQDCTSFALNCDTFDVWCNNQQVPSSGPRSSRVGVYLDHSAGVLNFYSVSETMNMTLINTVETTFFEPLYAALGFHDASLCPGTTAELCDLRHTRGT